MSIGAPSNLGTLLIQRLDTVLGTALGQQANLVNGAGLQAVPQPGTPENPNRLQNPAQRDTREAVDQAAAQGEQRAAVGKATREMQLDNLLGRSSTLYNATQSAPTTLGYAARIILALLNAYPEAGPAIRAQAPLVENPAPATTGGTQGQPTTGASPSGGAVTGTAPSWAQLATTLNQPGALAARLAEALTRSIQTSGLFYESHLAQLAGGKSSVQTLRQEPQGHVPPQAPGTLPGKDPDMALSQAHANQPPPASDTSLARQADTILQATTTGSNAGAPPSASPSPSPSPPIPGMDPQTQMLVRQQLEVLANQGFAWQGEAWPGAPLHWEIQHHEAHDPATRDFEGNHWSTRLALRLPALGDVQARLSLSGDHLVMRIAAPQSASTLSDAIEPLRSRLLARGLQASQISVTHDGAEPALADPSHEITAP